jgi:hypothetical protein
MGVAQHPLIVANAQDDRLGMLPVSVQMEHTTFVAPQDALNFGTVLPGYRWEASDLFNQPIVICGNQGHAQVA